MSFRLTISKIMIAFGIVIGVGIAAVVAANTIALNQVKPDGALHSRESLANELLADILPPPLYIIEPYLETLLLLDNPASVQMRGARLKELRHDYEDRKQYWAKHPVDADVSEALKVTLPFADQFWQVTENEFLPAMRESNKKAAQTSFETLTALYAQHRHAIDVLVPKTKQMADNYKSRAYETDEYFRTVSISVALFVLGVLAAGVLGIMLGVVRPIVKVNKAMKVLASGDYGRAVASTRRKDEVGQLVHSTSILQRELLTAQRSKEEQIAIMDSSIACIGEGLDFLAKGELTRPITSELKGPFSKLKDDFNGALARLRETIGVVLIGARKIGTGAGEISQSADDLSRRTEQQAASLEETAAALEEITATVKKTAANAKEASSIVRVAKTAAQEGGTVVGTAVASMNELQASSKQITEIIGVIENIAFQTNLLALNAGVEAARAGDAGRGFAIVATEVRALAQRSSEAAKQIEDLIKVSTARVEASARLVGETGQALTRIAAEVSQIDSLVTELAQASEQQSIGIEEVNAAVSQMDQVTQHNASMVDQTTAASRNLASETGHLISAVAFFRVGQSDNTEHHKARPKARPKQGRRPAMRGALALKQSAQPKTDTWEEF